MYWLFPVSVYNILVNENPNKHNSFLGRSVFCSECGTNLTQIWINTAPAQTCDKAVMLIYKPTLYKLIFS